MSIRNVVATNKEVSNFDSFPCPAFIGQRLRSLSFGRADRRVNKQRFRGQRRGTNCKNTRLCGSSASIAVNIGTQTDCGNGRLRRHHHHHLTISHSSSSSGPTSQHPPVTVQCSERVLILVCKHLDKGNLVVFLWKSNSGATEIEMWLNIDFLLIYRSNII